MQVYAQMSLIEGIYIDFTVVAAAATVVDRLQNPPIVSIDSESDLSNLIIIF